MPSHIWRDEEVPLAVDAARILRGVARRRRQMRELLLHIGVARIVGEYTATGVFTASGVGTGAGTRRLAAGGANTCEDERKPL
jgi:hypothetical protein